MHIGVISDTHGLLRPEALEALKGVSAILHAGDVGKIEILLGLKAIAPVIAVRGNIDSGTWERRLPLHETAYFGEVNVYMLHDINDLEIDPKEAGFQVVVHGHTHLAKIEIRKEVLYINPGAAGPKRFSLPVTLVIMEIEGKSVKAKITRLG